MTPIKWFRSFLKKYRRLLVIGFLLATCAALFTLVKPYLSGQIIDVVIKEGHQEALPHYIILMLAFVVLKGGSQFLLQVTFETCSQGVLYSMRDTVYRKLLQEDFSFYNKKRTGDLMSRQTGDMDAIRHFVANIIYTVYENSLMLIFALLMIFTINWKLALMMLTVLPLTALTAWRQSRHVRPCFKHIRDCFSSLNAFVQENISGNRVIKAFAKEDYEIYKFNKENDKYRDASLAASGIWEKYVPIFEVLSNLLNIILMLYGGHLVINGEITIGNLVTVSGYLWMLNNPLRMAGWWINDILRFYTSVEKIYATYIEEPGIKTPKHPVLKTRLKGEVTFNHVSYSADDEAIVKDICFHAASGSTVGIIGSTGSGKSTIMNLLCRFYDVTSGEVLVDGVNVKKLDLYNLRANIGMAMQDVFLFSDTIEGNIAYAKPDCTFEEVKKAAIMADANHFIQELPEGYDTIIGERGVGLSGGQKQRISLARALIKNPSILILDDTTSAVDMETESYIQSQLAKLRNNCTIFIIAYRISSIKDCDQILVLKDGHIAEHGTHDELMKHNGYYACTFYNQYGKITKKEQRSHGTK